MRYVKKRTLKKGHKTRRTIKNKHKSRKNVTKNSNKKFVHKMKGGRCYGNGVGSNNYDPDFSIYNTNMLELFPYKA
jgi:hypothetical protein